MATLDWLNFLRGSGPIWANDVSRILRETRNRQSWWNVVPGRIRERLRKRLLTAFGMGNADADRFLDMYSSALRQDLRTAGSDD